MKKLQSGSIVSSHWWAVFSLHVFHLVSVFLLSIPCICSVISFPLLCCILISFLPHAAVRVSLSDKCWLSKLQRMHTINFKLASVWLRSCLSIQIGDTCYKRGQSPTLNHLVVMSVSLVRYHKIADHFKALKN